MAHPWINRGDSRVMPWTLDDAMNLLRKVRKQNKRLRRQVGSKSYQDYLESPHWQHLRRMYITSKSQCCGCNSKKNLVLHHIYYSRLGDERTGDLAILCASCHDKLHKFLDSKYPGEKTSFKARKTAKCFESVFERPWQPEFEVRLPGRSQGRPQGLTKAQKKARSKIFKRNRALQAQRVSQTQPDRLLDTTGQNV